jgi:hypothetical protein
MKRNINDSAYLGDLLVTGYSVFPETGCLEIWLGRIYSQKRHDGNEHGFWRLLCYEKRL